MSATVAALFVRPDSIYKQLPSVDCYDLARDARTYSGVLPVIAHPPCRAWGRLRQFAKPRPDEKDLARFAVACVRRWGGVLEHPSASQLFIDQALPTPGTQQRDRWGGFTYPVMQSWWGHRAPKRTWLYIVGIEAADLPAIPFHLGLAAGCVCDGMRTPEREATPPAFADWLVDLAGRCEVRL